MDTSNWRPAQGPSDDPMECGDWRAHLQADSRKRIVYEIMDTLQRHSSFSGHEELQEAVRFEEAIYTAATSQSDYLRQISLKMPTMETRTQNPMLDAMQANFAAASLDSTAQTGNPNGGDWQEEVYQKIKAMKDLYLLDLNDMHQKILRKLQQHDSLPQQLTSEQLEKLKVFKNMLERFMQFLQIPKHGIMANYKDKLGTYERQIVNVINSNRRKPAPTQQQQQALPPPHMRSMQQSQQSLSRLTQVQSHDDQMNLQGSMASMQQNNMGSLQQNSVPSMSGGSNAQQNMMNSLQPSSNLNPGQNTIASLDLTSQTGNLNNGDWQEEVYQKIKAMKDLYLLDLYSMHQKIIGKLQQHDSLPQQLTSEQLEKLKVFKNMLERFMQFLQIPKHGILANYKDKLGNYEKQIVNVINSIRRKPAPTQQQQQALPPPHMHSMQQSQRSLSQLTQVQSHDNQMNLQGSMASMQQNDMGSLQQNFNQMTL